jgi:hypothetical protein
MMRMAYGKVGMSCPTDEPDKLTIFPIILTLLAALVVAGRRRESNHAASSFAIFVAGNLLNDAM